MSQGSVAAKRYAKALFESAREQNLLTEVMEDLQQTVDLLEQSEEFRKFWLHPNVDPARKKALIENALKKQINGVVYNTLRLLADRRREEVLPALLSHYRRLADEAMGRVRATAYVPYPVSKKEEKGIAEAFSKLTGKEVRLTTEVDESLLGGIRVRIGDRLYDGSLSGKLASLEKTLTGGSITVDRGEFI